MAHDDLTERLRATFIDELDEQVADLNAGLLRLEQQPADIETVRALFRAAHTVKGAARVAGMPLIEQACHALEAVFAAARDGERRLDGGAFSLLFGVVDALADAGVRLRRREDLDDSTLADLLPRLVDAAGGAAGDPADGRRRASATRDSWREPPDGTARQPSGAPASAPREPASSPVGRQAATASPARPAAPARDGDEQVRIRADRLDELLTAVGELVVSTGRVLDELGRQHESARRLDAATAMVSDVVHTLRLRPFGDICQALPRAVRDVAAASGREVVLKIEGEEVEADRLVMDALREPLLHLVRNAVDHGIEPPDERVRLGKPPAGSVRVSAELASGRLVISVSDDGAGLDEAALRRSLRSAGRAVPQSSRELAEELLLGGVTTRTQATSISGRGVGLDIVRSAVERVGGAVDVRWRSGRGTTFLLECPPTPATIRALLIRMGPHSFAIPTAHVERLLRVRTEELRHSEGRTLFTVAGEPVAVHSLAALLGPPIEARPLGDSGTVVVVSAGPRRAALLVDEAVDEDEIVVRPLQVDDDAVPHATGAAVLPTGQIALVLGVPPLLAAARRAGTGIAPLSRPEQGPDQRRILVADDSITTRTLEQSVLESAGFAVSTAVNGEDAWHRLQQEGVDLLVADVEMPRMDGIALCRRIRASGRFADLPIILVTGLESEEDRARGMEAGADAYIVKSSFDQATLLETVQQLIGGE
jgi:two-component system, chemotaxis family, sensor kinase CheA